MHGDKEVFWYDVMYCKQLISFKYKLSMIWKFASFFIVEVIYISILDSTYCLFLGDKIDFIDALETRTRMQEQ